MNKYMVISTDKGIISSTNLELFRTVNPFSINWTKTVEAESEKDAKIKAKLSKEGKK